MVEEVISILADIDTQCSKDDSFAPANRERVAMYLDIVKDTMANQHTIIDSYETITKKMEAQISECQEALDESTKRELEQLELIVKLKDQHDALNDSDGEDDQDEDCDKCNEFEEENQILREQVEKQSEIIEKLSRAQELLMMQYKIMELGLNKELASIHNTQKQIAKMQGKGSDDEEEEEENEEEEQAEEEPEAEGNASDKQVDGEKSDDKQE